MVLLDFSNDASQSPDRAYLLDVCIPEDHARGLSTATLGAGVGGILGSVLGGINWDKFFIGKVLGSNVRTVFKEVPLDLLQIESSLDSTPSFRQYLMSIIVMPWSLKILYITNMFSWMSHVCYSLYFTDFVGEAVFGGVPMAPKGSELRLLYEDGVRFGCWGVALYCVTCSCYSIAIERLINRFKAKVVYVGSLLTYSLSMFLMAILRSKISILIFSCTGGIMYPTIFTMPFILVANYHENKKFETDPKGLSSQVRGLGTDVSIVSSAVFLAQFLLCLLAGSVVSWAGTTTAITVLSSFFALCSAIAASQIVYMNL